jgi:hypothetical protein
MGWYHFTSTGAGLLLWLEFLNPSLGVFICPYALKLSFRSQLLEVMDQQESARLGTSSTDIGACHLLQPLPSIKEHEKNGH